MLMLFLAAATCFTTTLPEFEKDAVKACAEKTTKAVDVSGAYPGDVTLTITYTFDLGAAGPREIAGTGAAMDAYKAAVVSNLGLRGLHPEIKGYTLVMRDAKSELCRFTFDAIQDAPKTATCATLVGK